MRCPKNICKEVKIEAAASACDRRDTVRAKNNRYIAKTRESMIRRFPKISRKSVEVVLQHGFEKDNERVDRSTVIINEKKIVLTVTTHTRHTRTPNNTILSSLENGKLGRKAIRDKTRSRIRRQLDEILNSWEAPIKPSSKASREAKIKAKHSLGTSHVRESLNKTDTQVVHKTTAATVKPWRSFALESSPHAPSLGQKRPRTVEEEASMPVAKRPKNARFTAPTAKTAPRPHDLDPRQHGKPAPDQEVGQVFETGGGYHDCLVLWESPVVKPKKGIARNNPEASTRPPSKREPMDEPIEILDLSIARANRGFRSFRSRRSLA